MAKVTVRVAGSTRSVEMSNSSARLIMSLAIKLALLDENVAQACEPPIPVMRCVESQQD